MIGEVPILVTADPSRDANGAIPRLTHGILAVDDDPACVHALTTVLRRTGQPIVSARSGEEALFIAAKVRPDLILLDISMPPGIDGYETIRRLKQNPDLQHTPIIVLSSHTNTRDKVEAITLGAVDYIAKPFRAQEVLARVNAHLLIHSLQQDLAERNAELLAANHRMATDLKAAAQFQRALLPSTLPPSPGYTIAWASRPCHEVGGDSLDFFNLNDTTSAFYLLDVSGHGVTACLLAVSVARSLTPRPDRSSLVTEPGWNLAHNRIVPPGEVLRRLNVINPMDSQRNPHFITMIYALLDRTSGTVRFASAGHPPPILVHPDGSSQVFDGGSIPLGVDPATEYEDFELRLQPGDRLIFHSDGAFEQTNSHHQQFTLDRLRHIFSQGRMTLNDRVNHAMQRVIDWASPAQPSDDVSFLAIERA